MKILIVQIGRYGDMILTTPMFREIHRAHPTAEPYLPLLVAAGAARQALPASVIEGGIVHGVLSMDSFLFGADLAVGQDAAASALTTN